MRSSHCIRSIPLLRSVPLYAPALVPDVSSPVSPTYTTELPVPKSLRDFRYVYTHRSKVPAFESVPTNSSPMEGSSPETLATLFDLDVPVALSKDRVSILTILYPISFSMIVLILLFASLPCLCLLSLLLGLMRRQYWYQHGSRYG